MSMYIQIIAMALFQGIAEFLPISSSGHLELLGALFNIREDERLTLSVILHAGTLFSMLVFYFKDIIAIFLKKLLPSNFFFALLIKVCYINQMIVFFSKK